MKIGQIKYPYVLRVLEDKLELENKMLISFRNTEPIGPYGKQSIEKNIHGCEFRINELLLGIKEVKSIVYSKEECENNKNNNDENI